MFDEDCYNSAYRALDRDFKDGRYHIVTGPTAKYPYDRVIHLQSPSNNNNYSRRGGSSNNLLVVDDPYLITDRPTNGYLGSPRKVDFHDGLNDKYRKSKSSHNLNEYSSYSPRPGVFAEQSSSYEYYRKNGVQPRVNGNHIQERLQRDSISSDDRNFYGHDGHYLRPRNIRRSNEDSESSDDMWMTVGSKYSRSGNPSSVLRSPRSQQQRIFDEKGTAHSWDLKPPFGNHWGEVREYNSFGKLNSSHYGDDSSSTKHQFSNNVRNYFDPRQNYDKIVKRIEVERSDSGGTGDFSARDYWEGRWSSTSGEDRGRYIKSASPSISSDFQRRTNANKISRAREQYFSAGDLLANNHKSLGIFKEKSNFASINETKPNPNSRVIYDGSKDRLRNCTNQNNFATLPSSSQNYRITNTSVSNSKEKKSEAEFLSKVQQELEHQRQNLTGEIDRLLSPMGTDFEKARSPVGSPPSSFSPSAPTFNAEKNSFFDTTGPFTVFKAFVDVSDYPPNSVTVGLDHLGNKVIVEARQDENPQNPVATSFTQKIPIPRYADVTSMTAMVNRKGIVKIEIPLLFYFPSDHVKNKNSTDNLEKSFVYEVKTDARNGSKVMEIVVIPGPEVTIHNLKIEVTEDRQMAVLVEKESSGVSGKQRHVIKTYSLPSTAVLNEIRSKMSNDGTLTVSIPIGR